MSISFPTSLDTLTNPTSTSKRNSPSHAGQHSDANDAIEALEAKVGADSSAVTSSVDYKLTNTSSSNPGHKHTLADGATDITASASEVNLIDGAVAGTAVASKVVVLDGSKDFDFGTGDISATLGTFTDDVRLANTKSVQFKDSGATYRDVVTVDGSNNVNVGDSNLTGQIVFAQTFASSVQPSCMAVEAGTQSIANASFQAITFGDTDDWDTASLHDPSTNNSRITIPASLDGEWLFDATISFDSNATGTRQVLFKIDGSTYLQQGYVNIGANAASSTKIYTAARYIVSGGCYVEVFGYQSSGGALNCDEARFGAYKLR